MVEEELREELKKEIRAYFEIQENLLNFIKGINGNVDYSLVYDLKEKSIFDRREASSNWTFQDPENYLFLYHSNNYESYVVDFDHSISNAHYLITYFSDDFPFHDELIDLYTLLKDHSTVIEEGDMSSSWSHEQTEKLRENEWADELIKIDHILDMAVKKHVGEWDILGSYCTPRIDLDVVITRLV